ncbi:MAG: hemerythrin family protein [Planctomycetes bacterium]|nr:hemerythrin family protein [Planctomycetota bacterium]
MNTIVWEDRFLINDPEIDRQHQELIKLANVVLELKSIDKDSLSMVFKGLTKYTRFHFAREEEYMQQLGFPALASHRVLHRTIVVEMDRLLHESTTITELQERLRNLLYGWVLDHIASQDAAIARFAVDHPR